jgi:hypothetical protein
MPMTKPGMQELLSRTTAMTRAQKLDDLELEIQARSPRPSARSRVGFIRVPTPSAFLTLVRLLGDRDDVLDFAALLYEEVRGMVRPDGRLPISVAAIESESSEHIQLLLRRELYDN